MLRVFVSSMRRNDTCRHHELCVRLLHHDILAGNVAILPVVFILFLAHCVVGDIPALFISPSIDPQKSKKEGAKLLAKNITDPHHILR